jgi:hypothetical protein
MKIFGAILESFGSRSDKSLKLVFGTQEASPEDASFCQSAVHKHVAIAIKEDPFTRAELDDLDKLAVEYTDTEKSPSKRLKSVLYRVWELDSEGHSDFTDYYIAKMNKLVEHFKAKLP